MRRQRWNPIDLGAIVLARGSDHRITESMSWDEGYCELVRTVNGDLRALMDGHFRKRVYRVSGTGIRPPALSAFPPGSNVSVIPATPEMLFVPPGEVGVGMDGYYPQFDPWGEDAETGEPVGVTFDGSQFVVADEAFGRPVVVMFRTQISCIVESVSLDDDVNGAETSWSVDFREV